MGAKQIKTRRNTKMGWMKNTPKHTHKHEVKSKERERKRARETDLNGLNRRLVQAIQMLSNLKLLP